MLDALDGRTTIGNLPVELIIRVCCFLDPVSIDNVGLISRSHRDLVHDDTLWKIAFHERFPNTQGFSPLATSWRQEYISRSALTRKFLVGRGTHVLFDARIGLVTHMYVDAHSAEAICGNMTNGLGSVIADRTTGKVKKEYVYPSSNRTMSADVTAMATTKHGLVYGYRNGRIATSTSAKGSRLFNHTVYRGWHEGNVNAIAISDNAANSRITMATGGSEGCIKLWDHRDPMKDCLAEHKLFDRSVEHIIIDASKDRIFAMTIDGLFSIRWTKSDEPKSPIVLAVTECFVPAGCQRIVLDRRSSSIVLSRGSSLFRYELQGDEFVPSQFSSEMEDDIGHLAIDSAEQPIDHTAPGSDGRHLVCASAGTVLVFNCRKSGSKPLCHIPWPYETITCLAVNPVVVAVGSVDGAVRVFEALTAHALRPLSGPGLEGSRSFTVNYTIPQVSRMFLDPLRPAGTICIGAFVKTFDLDPGSGHTNGKRKALDRRTGAHKPSTLTSRSKALNQQLMQEELAEHLQQSKEVEEQARLARFAGAGQLSDSMTEAEILSYTQMLSREDLAKARADDELEEVLRLSLLDVVPTPGQADFSTSTSQSAGYDESELAIALSLSELIQ